MQINSKKEWYKLGLSPCWNKADYYNRWQFMRLFWDIKVQRDNFMVRSLKDSCFKGFQGNIAEVKKYVDDNPQLDVIIGRIVDDSQLIVQGMFDGEIAEVSYKKETLKTAINEGHLNTRLSRTQLRAILGDKWYFIMKEWIDLYPDHIIEFSFYETGVGSYKEELVIWEIRKY